MRWVDIVTITDLVVACSLGTLFFITLLKKEKSLVDRLLTVLLFFQLAWVILDGLAVFLAVYFDTISDFHGGLIGVSIIGMVLAIAVFGEFFPDSRPFPGHRFRILASVIPAVPLAGLVFTPYWVANRRVVDGIKIGDQGPAFYALTIWILGVLGVNLITLFRKSRHMRDPRGRRNLRFLSAAILVNLVLSLTTASFLPLLGFFQLDFIGPVVSLLFMAIVLYAMNFHSLYDIQRATLRFIFHLLIGIALCAIVFGIIHWMIPGHGAEHYPAEFLLLLTANVLYIFYLQPALDVFLKRDTPYKDGMLLKLLSGRVLEHDASSLQSLLDHVLDALMESMGIKSGALLARDRLHGTSAAYRLNAPVGGFAGLERLLDRVGRRNLPEDFLNVFDGIFLIERNNRSPDALRIDELLFFLEKYPAIRRLVVKVEEDMRNARIQLFIPLILHKKILGFILLGEQEGRMPYFKRELDLLRNLRATIALAIRNHVNQQELRTLNRHAEAELDKLTDYISRKPGIKETIHGRTLVYKSPLMGEILEETRKVSAARERPILVLGETGTGKELIARKIHEERNATEPFVAVNCAAIPDTMWESDIFGHTAGAFTDAKGPRKGRVEQAGAGTLFFDEIGEMPLQIQSRLLRLLQERVYTPLGASGEIRAKCNFIFATNRNLEEMTAAGDFREDLYFRINVLPIKIPALRDRREDIPVLVMHFIEKFAPELQCGIEEIEASAMSALIHYHWPGNIRELENILIRAMAGTETSVLTRRMLPPLIGLRPSVASEGGREPGLAHPDAIPLEAMRGNFRALVKNYRSSLLQRALKHVAGNQTHAAEFLGLNRTTLMAQVSELGIDPLQFKQ